MAIPKQTFFYIKRKREIVPYEQSLSFFLDLFIIEFYIQAVIHFYIRVLLDITQWNG